jgi:hypothetical protein
VFGDVENEELAEADAEDVARLVVELALAQGRDPVVEEAPVAKDGEENAVEQGAVLGRQVVALGMPLDEGFGVDVPLGPGTEGGDGGAPDVFVGLRHGEGGGGGWGP